jgi:hypothetical protein
LESYLVSLLIQLTLFGVSLIMSFHLVSHVSSTLSSVSKLIRHDFINEALTFQQKPTACHILRNVSRKYIQGQIVSLKGIKWDCVNSSSTCT